MFFYNANQVLWYKNLMFYLTTVWQTGVSGLKENRVKFGLPLFWRCSPSNPQVWGQSKTCVEEVSWWELGTARSCCWVQQSPHSRFGQRCPPPGLALAATNPCESAVLCSLHVQSPFSGSGRRRWRATKTHSWCPQGLAGTEQSTSEIAGVQPAVWETADVKPVLIFIRK